MPHFRGGVIGWVKNDAAGSVLCEVQARPDVLEEFLARVGEGPGFARVNRVHVEEMDAVPDDTGFEVRH